MMLRSTVSAALVLCAASLSAQEIQAHAAQGQRAETGMFLALMEDGQFAGAAGAVFITYGVPVWKDEYEAELDELTKGRMFRLGKDNWATFDSTAPVSFGTTTVPTGLYYLAIARDEEDAWSLVFIDPAKAKAAGAWPFDPKKAPRAHTVALKHRTTDKITEKLSVKLIPTEGSPTKGTLEIAWGGHVATAPLEIELPAPKEATGHKDG